MQRLFRWTVAALLLVAAACSALMPQNTLDRMTKIFQTMDFSSNLVKLGLLLFLVVFAGMLRLPWQSLPAGIAVGFAVSAASEIAAAPLMSALGKSYYQRIDVLRMGATLVCVLIWLVYLFLPNETVVKETQIDKRKLELWGQDVKRMVQL
jgi:uncharacterized BrkB/YihY/UPF0761 family membrane protein